AEFDLVSGHAGAIVACVLMDKLLTKQSALEMATTLGDDLINTAQRSEAGLSWRSVHFPTRRNLTGFSHGTAGVGFALNELSNATGEARFRVAAEQAFLYERDCFDPITGNWPDFRQHPSGRQRTGTALPVATFWCHGAPGIALSRLRAYQLL